jgi:hypothetical protein
VDGVIGVEVGVVGMQELSIVVVAIVDDVFVVFLLVAAYGSDGEKHFNFMGQGTPSPVNPLAYGTGDA